MAYKVASYTDQKVQRFWEKAQDHSISEATLTTVGPLEYISPDIKWRGKISVEARVNAGEITKNEIDEAFELARGCYVLCSEDLPVRCGDERSDKNYQDDEINELKSGLGPQCLGASVSQAVAFGLLNRSKTANYKSNICQEIQEFSKFINMCGQACGTHGDTLAGKEGCGANKSQQDQLLIISGADNAFKKMVKAYLGEKYWDDAIFDKVAKAANDSLTQDGVYVPSAEEIVNKVESINDSGYVEKTGVHLGVGVIKNMVEGTTLHNNHLNTLTRERLEFFNVDFWFDHKLAKVLANSKEDELFYLHARAAQTIATGMLLLDGTLIYAIRS